MKIDFATFVHQGDAHRLYAPGQLRRQVESNNYNFNRVIVVHQCFRPAGYGPLDLDEVRAPIIENEAEMTDILEYFEIDHRRPQYESDTDRLHRWRYHVVNHLRAIQESLADYIVFADSDCWMVRQPPGVSWVDAGLAILRSNPDIFIVSPNDGEPARKTQRMSQQMFMVKIDDFIFADFNQPGYTGNPRDYDTMPEYHAMLEGRMHYHCRATNRYRYVLPPDYRYFHHNRLTADGMYDTDYEKLGWV
jgi:hypothetical protein